MEHAFAWLMGLLSFIPGVGHDAPPSWNGYAEADYAYAAAPGGGTIAAIRIAEGDTVVIEARAEMMSKAGAPYNNEYCLFYRLRDRKIVEMTEYQDSTLCERVLGPYRAEPAS